MSDLEKYHFEKLIDCINAAQSHIDQLSELDGMPVIACTINSGGEKVVQVLSTFDFTANFPEHDTYMLNKKSRRLSIEIEGVEIFTLKEVEEIK